MLVVSQSVASTKRKSKVTRKGKVIQLRTAHEFECLVYEYARQLIEAELQWPADRDGPRVERPAKWPLTNDRFDRPYGKAGAFHGLTHTPRELLKIYRSELPPLLNFGLLALAWWHREVWYDGLRRCKWQSFGEYVRSIIPTWGPKFACEGELRALYGAPDRPAKAN